MFFNKLLKILTQNHSMNPNTFALQATLSYSKNYRIDRLRFYFLAVDKIKRSWRTDRIG